MEGRRGNGRSEFLRVDEETVAVSQRGLDGLGAAWGREDPFWGVDVLGGDGDVGLLGRGRGEGL